MKDFISMKDLAEFSQSFKADIANTVAMNAVCSSGLNNAARRFEVERSTTHNFNVNLEQHGIGFQKNSGRCWMFAGFNVIRDTVIKKLNLDDFNFSGNYLMFYDKLEKSNFFLEKIIQYADEAHDSRIMERLSRPAGDGGEWQMFVNLVNKYGIVPASVQPETVSTDNSRGLGPVIQEQLRQFGRDLRAAHSAGKSDDELRQMKDGMMETMYRMFSICYGTPVKTFDFMVRNKKGELICDRGITPQEFYAKYVGVDLTEYVALNTGSSYGKELKKFVYPDNGDIIEGIPTCYVSVPMETMKETSIAMLKDGMPVWFTCDVTERYWRAGGILDTEVYNYDELLDIKLDMTKEERFLYNQARMSHAMVFKGVDLDENGKPLNWRVENTWGSEPGKKGMFSMTDKWFETYTYQVIVHRKYVSDEIAAAYYGDEAVVLDNWVPVV